MKNHLWRRRTEIVFLGLGSAGVVLGYLIEPGFVENFILKLIGSFMMCFGIMFVSIATSIYLKRGRRK